MCEYLRLCVSQKCSAAESTNSESLSLTASRTSLLRNVTSLCARVRVCTVCASVREREKESVISVHKKGGKQK